MATTYGDSPTRLRHTHTRDYRSAHVAQSRMTLMRDLPEVVEVSLDTLIDAAIPLVDPGEFDKVCAQLCSTGQITDSDSDNPRWKCLPHDPANSKKSEAKEFKFFEVVANAIDGIRSKESKPESLVKLIVAGETSPCGHRNNASRPDGYFCLQTAILSLVRWIDILLPMEFKNKNNAGNAIDDYIKVIWSMHHIMHTDARRRYVLGLTCENTTARLWYNDRCDIVASDGFDINKDWKRLVRIILSILEATAIELGYDPNMVAHNSANPDAEPQYDITLHNVEAQSAEVYRTVKIISDVGADSIVGRGTRVWEVQRLVDGKPVAPSYALKSVWVHIDRGAEHVLLEKIRKEQPNYAKYFLTPRDHGFAPLDPAIPHIIFDTHSPLGRKRKLRPTGEVLHTRQPSSSNISSNKTPSASRDSIGHSEGISNSPPEGGFREFSRLSEHPRQNYFILFEEIGRPVHKLYSFPDVFTAVEGGWEGLHAIHLCKHVHRDVSSGNILLVPASKGLSERGVIMDLEYGKGTEDMSGPHDVRTGTEAFMATEVAFAEHHRLIELRLPRQQSTSLEELSQIVRVPDPQAIAQRIPLPPFRHNPLHDMESIWWLCTWMVIHLIPSNGNVPERLALYRNVFRSREVKQKVFCQRGVFGQLIQGPPELELLLQVMDSWLTVFNELYRVSYQKQVSSSVIRIDDATIQFSYDAGKKYLQALHSVSQKISVEFIWLSETIAKEPPTGASCRRKAEDSRDNTQAEDPRENTKEHNDVTSASTTATTTSRVILPPFKKIRAER